MGSLWEHYGIILGSFWDHYGIIMGSLQDHFGIIMELFWDHYGIILGFLSINFCSVRNFKVIFPGKRKKLLRNHHVQMRFLSGIGKWYHIAPKMALEIMPVRKSVIGRLPIHF